jgi:hypothetical protein
MGMRFIFSPVGNDETRNEKAERDPKAERLARHPRQLAFFRSRFLFTLSDFPISQ